jgi:phosphatidylinositol alpha-mannosyltransferase
MSNLKIGFVFDDSLDKADGVQQYVLSVGKWLQIAGHEVHYLVGRTKRTDLEHIHSLGTNVAARFNGNRMSIPLPTSKQAIKKLLDEEQFDVLHVQLPYSPWLAQRVIAAAGPKTVIFGTFHIVPHSWVVRSASRVLATWTRPTLKRFDEIVSVSTAAQSFAKRTFRLETTVLPNVVDYARFKRAKPAPKQRDVLTVLFLGRLVPRKGCQTLLDAVDILSKRMSRLPAFQVIICGRGPLEASLKRFVEERQLSSLIQFTGFIEEADKPRYLSTADIAVFPSTGGESFGIVLIEAMAAGAMVLAGDNVGYRSVMTPKPELLFSPKNAEELADKLAYYLQHPAERLAAKTWQDHYVRDFDVTIVGKELVDRYNQALHLRQNVQ